MDADQKDQIIEYMNVLWVVMLVYVIVSVLFVIPIIPEQTQYTYDVKMEQAQNIERLNDSDIQELSEFSDDERDVLYEAFKNVETGQLINDKSAEASVTFDERRATFDDTWKTVEINGIIFLVAIQENVNEINDTSVWWVMWWEAMLLGSYVFTVIWGAVLLLMVR